MEKYESQLDLVAQGKEFLLLGSNEFYGWFHSLKNKEIEILYGEIQKIHGAFSIEFTALYNKLLKRKKSHKKKNYYIEQSKKNVFSIVNSSIHSQRDWQVFKKIILSPYLLFKEIDLSNYDARLYPNGEQHLLNPSSNLQNFSAVRFQNYIILEENIHILKDSFSENLSIFKRMINALEHTISIDKKIYTMLGQETLTALHQKITLLHRLITLLNNKVQTVITLAYTINKEIVTLQKKKKRSCTLLGVKTHMKDLLENIEEIDKHTIFFIEQGRKTKNSLGIKLQGLVEQYASKMSFEVTDTNKTFFRSSHGNDFII